VLGPALRSQPDRRLVTLVREGYEAAFEEIVRRYAKPLGRYAAAIVGSRGEDVIQDSFSKALLALRRDDAEIELRPWLYRIVRNTALNDLRDRPPSAEALAEAIAGGRSAAEEAERREELTDLMRRLRELPESQRAAIVMRELEGLSHEEIATALGLSGGAARQAIHRARQALRDGLGMLLPLPLLKALIDHGGEAALAGAGAGGAVAAGGAVGGGSAGLALKAGVVTAVLAGSVGTGVALRENRGQDEGSAAASAARVTAGTAPASAPTPAPAAESEEAIEAATAARAQGEDGESQGKDEGERRGGGPGSGGSGNRGALPGFAPADGRGLGPRHHGDRSGPGSGHGADHGGRGPRPGGEEHGFGGSRSGPGPSDGTSHSGRGGSGSDGSGDHGGHGGGDGRGDPPPPEEGQEQRGPSSGPGPGEPLPPPPPPEEEPRDDGGKGPSDGRGGGSEELP
jgi:RNA polymerase sigma factor (sigma-70 family)